MRERRSEQLHFRVSETELERIHEKMAEAGIVSIGAYLRKMALDGYCVQLDLDEIRSMAYLLALFAGSFCNLAAARVRAWLLHLLHCHGNEVESCDFGGDADAMPCRFGLCDVFYGLAGKSARQAERDSLVLIFCLYGAAFGQPFFIFNREVILSQQHV